MCFRIKPYISTVSLFPCCLFHHIYCVVQLLCCSIYSLIIAIFSFWQLLWRQKSSLLLSTRPPSPGVPRLSSVGISTARLHTCGHMCRLRTLSRNRLYMFVCISRAQWEFIWYWMTMNELLNSLYVFLLSIRSGSWRRPVLCYDIS